MAMNQLPMSKITILELTQGYSSNSPIPTESTMRII